ncbi:MAG: hypothetical protein ACI4XW_03075 [Candidatus Spyradocola sp.]
MNVKRLLVRLAREVPCLVSLVILAGLALLVTGCFYEVEIPVSWWVLSAICTAIGMGWALLEVWCVRRKWLRVEHLSFLNIEACILFSPLLPFVMMATGIGIESLMLWTPLLAVLAVRLISWRFCEEARKRTLRQGWLLVGGIVSEILMLLICWGCSELVWEESAWGYLLMFAVLLLGRVAVERRLVLSGVLGRGERTVLAWFDGTNIVTVLISARELLRSDPVYIPSIVLAAGLCAAMVCAAVFARKVKE